jgi:VWFA-related protein
MQIRKATGFAVFGASLLGVALALGAQQQAAAPAPADIPTAPTITANSHLVNLPVVVRDKNGALVATLNKDDFALAVDGRKQPIRYFDRDNDLPLTLGLLVDISGSVRSALANERTASETFLDQMVTSPGGRPPDQAFLIQFAREADLLQDLTPSVPKLRAALNRVGDENRDNSRGGNSGRNNGGYGGRGRGRGFGGGTTLYDAIYLGSTDLMQKQQGRKAIIVLTDGEDRGSMETLSKAIAAAQRSETVVYAIYFKGEQHGYGGYGHGGYGGRGGFPGGGRGGYPGGGYPGGGGPGGGHGSEQNVDGRKVLTQITKETGGRMFEVSGKQTFSAIYSQIGEELRSQYRLGYVPDADGAAEGFHRVELSELKDKKLFIQTRNGYYVGQ